LNSRLVASVKMEDLKVWIAKRPRNSSLTIGKLWRKTGIQPLELKRPLR